MQMLILIPSFVLFLISIALPIIVVMGGGAISDIEGSRDKYLSSSNFLERWIAILVYLIVDHRLAAGVISAAGVIGSFFAK